MTRGVILTADGFSETQLAYSYHRLREDAILTDVASPDGGAIEGRRGVVRNDTIAVANLAEKPVYDAVIVPGGAAPDRIVTDDDAVDWLSLFVAGSGVLGTIGRGVRTLVETEAVSGRTVTGPAELRPTVEGAGATWTDEDVTVDGTIVTARGTESLPFAIAATISNLSIPQEPAAEAVERPHWGESGSSP